MKRIFLLLGAFAATLALASCGNRVISYLPPSPNDVIHHDIKKPGEENKDEAPEAVEPEVVMYTLSIYNGDTLLLEKEYEEGTVLYTDDFDSYFDQGTLKENEEFWGFHTEGYIGIKKSDVQELTMNKDIKLVPYIRIKYEDNNEKYGLTKYFNSVFAGEVKYEYGTTTEFVDNTKFDFKEDVIEEKEYKDDYKNTVSESFMNPSKYVTFEATPIEGGVIVKVETIFGDIKFGEFTDTRIRVIELHEGRATRLRSYTKIA